MYKYPINYRVFFILQSNQERRSTSMQDIGKLLKDTMVEKRCDATCAFLYIAQQNAREAQKSCDSATKTKKE